MASKAVYQRVLRKSFELKDRARGIQRRSSCNDDRTSDAKNVKRAFFGRPIKRYAANVHLLLDYVRFVVRCFRLFENPWQVLSGYLRGVSPSSGCVRLRSGLVIHLSTDPLDIVTVFLIFVREDYGHIPSGSIVIDAGANIGVFSLFAAFSGASVVHAFEPNGASFECLVRNIDANDLSQKIRAHRVALAGNEGEIRFPVSPSVHNAIIPDDAEVIDFDLVRATTLSRILECAPHVDFLKLDCEGAEYDILLSSDTTVLSKCKVICTECHVGPIDSLVNFMTENGFTTAVVPDPAGGIGYLRFIRKVGAHIQDQTGSKKSPDF